MAMTTRIFTKTPFEGSCEERRFTSFLCAFKIGCKSHDWVFGQSCRQLREPKEQDESYCDKHKIWTKEVENALKVEAIMMSMLGTEPRQLIQETLDNSDEQPCPRFRIKKALQQLRDLYFENLIQTVSEMKGEYHNLSAITTFQQLESLVCQMTSIHVELLQLDSEHKKRFGSTVSFSNDQISTTFQSKLVGENFRVSRDDIAKAMQIESEKNEKKLENKAEFYRRFGKNVLEAGEDSGDEQREMEGVMNIVRRRLGDENRARKCADLLIDTAQDVLIPDEVKIQLEAAWQQGFQEAPTLNQAEAAAIQKCPERRQQRRQGRMNSYAEEERKMLAINKPDQEGMGLVKLAAIVRRNRSAHSRSEPSSDRETGVIANVAIIDQGGRGRSQESQRMRSPSRERSQLSQTAGDGMSARWEGQGGEKRRWGEEGGGWGGESVGGGGGHGASREDRGRSQGSDQWRQGPPSPSRERWGRGGGEGDGGRGRGGGGERDVKPRWEDRKRSPSAERGQQGHSPSGWGGGGGAGGGGWGGRGVGDRKSTRLNSSH